MKSNKSELRKLSEYDSNLCLNFGDIKVGTLVGDSLKRLKAIKSAQFNVAVTSPPYYWARDYGVDGQLGHEDSPDEFVNNLCDVFDEVKRLLHNQGVFFLNIGDTYYSGRGQPQGTDPKNKARNFLREKFRAVDRPGWDLPTKSQIGIPWRVVFEMQKRGWTLRKEIIWNRVNALPEPTAKDRPWCQFESVFMFTKSRFYSVDMSVLPLDEQDVWNIPIKRQKRIHHNASFPEELARRCILMGSPAGGNVLDPFSGSGTTIEVAMRHGRNALGVELNHKYAIDSMNSIKERNHGADIDSIDSLVQGLNFIPDSYANWIGYLPSKKKTSGIESLTVQSLKDRCRLLNLTTKGNKKSLIAFVKDNLSNLSYTELKELNKECKFKDSTSRDILIKQILEQV
jgi:DNA modification methylase